jgi:archaeosortase A (PGF-CTERM-specific)
MVLPSLPGPVLLTGAFLGMALLGFGALWRDPRNHWPRIAGWMLFGLYWPFKAQGYFAAEDPFNGVLALAAPLLTGYIAYHEYLSWTWDEQPVALTWLAGAAFVAATTYFTLFEITVIQERVIYWTGVESSWLTDTLFGTNSYAFNPKFEGLNQTVIDRTTAADPNQDYVGTHICLDQGYHDSVESNFCGALGPTGSTVGAAAAGFPYYAVTIVFACTALQSVMIFVGAIAFTKADTTRKLKAYAISVPTIYLLNLFRNAGIIYGYRVKNWTLFGLDSFTFMHSYVAKLGAIVALVAIALAVFRTLPELHENILDVLSLHRRERARPPSPPTEAPTES